MASRVRGRVRDRGRGRSRGFDPRKSELGTPNNQAFHFGASYQHQNLPWWIQARVVALILSPHLILTVLGASALQQVRALTLCSILLPTLGSP